MCQGGRNTWKGPKHSAENTSGRYMDRYQVILFRGIAKLKSQPVSFILNVTFIVLSGLKEYLQFGETIPSAGMNLYRGD